MVHLLAVLVDLLVAVQQLLVQLLDLHLVVVELEELHLHVGPHHFVLQPLVPLRLEGTKVNGHGKGWGWRPRSMKPFYEIIRSKFVDAAIETGLITSGYVSRDESHAI